MTTITSTDAQALFGDVCTAWNDADASALAGHYAHDGRLIDPFGGVADGRDAIEGQFTEMFTGLLAGTTTRIDVATVRGLTPGLVVVDGTQTLSGPLPPLHFTAIVRQVGNTAEIVECRPYAFLPRP